MKFCGFCFQFPCSCDEVGSDLSRVTSEASLCEECDDADSADAAVIEAAGAYLGLGPSSGLN